MTPMRPRTPRPWRVPVAGEASRRRISHGESRLPARASCSPCTTIAAPAMIGAAALVPAKLDV